VLICRPVFHILCRRYYLNVKHGPHSVCCIVWCQLNAIIFGHHYLGSTNRCTVCLWRMYNKPGWCVCPDLPLRCVVLSEELKLGDIVYSCKLIDWNSLYIIQYCENPRFSFIINLIIIGIIHIIWLDVTVLHYPINVCAHNLCHQHGNVCDCVYYGDVILKVIMLVREYRFVIAQCFFCRLDMKCIFWFLQAKKKWCNVS